MRFNMFELNMFEQSFSYLCSWAISLCKLPDVVFCKNSVHYSPLRHLSSAYYLFDL